MTNLLSAYLRRQAALGHEDFISPEMLTACADELDRLTTLAASEKIVIDAAAATKATEAPTVPPTGVNP